MPSMDRVRSPSERGSSMEQPRLLDERVRLLDERTRFLGDQARPVGRRTHFRGRETSSLLGRMRPVVEETRSCHR